MDNSILTDLRDAFLDRGGLDAVPESAWRRVAALNTWGTNAVEGSTITREEAERLVLDGESVGGHPMPEVLETVQHERAFRELLDRRKEDITLETVLEFHEDMFKGSKRDAGRWRRTNVRIRGASYSPPRAEKVVSEMDGWVEEYRQRDLRGEAPFEVGAWMHYEFERIHPFTDGNGRVGRILLNLHFVQRNWAPVHVLPNDRETYLSALNSAADGDLSPLVEFLKEKMAQSLVDLLDVVGTSRDGLLELKEVAERAPYSPDYLGLRAKEGELPAFKEKGRWRTSGRAVELYREHVGRK
ncbi:MAG: hypothetical protein MAG715_00531 [Methanonatronarchaeales archaeon]|nr:hypothetical protein [Methanonatronarchaeales archaeon]